MVYISVKRRGNKNVYVCVYGDVSTYFCKINTGRINQRMIKFVTYRRYVETD